MFLGCLLVCLLRGNGEWLVRTRIERRVCQGVWENNFLPLFAALPFCCQQWWWWRRRRWDVQSHFLPSSPPPPPPPPPADCLIICSTIFLLLLLPPIPIPFPIPCASSRLTYLVFNSFSLFLSFSPPFHSSGFQRFWSIAPLCTSYDVDLLRLLPLFFVSIFYIWSNSGLVSVSCLSVVCWERLTCCSLLCKV